MLPEPQGQTWRFTVSKPMPQNLSCSRSQLTWHSVFIVALIIVVRRIADFPGINRRDTVEPAHHDQACEHPPQDPGFLEECDHESDVLHRLRGPSPALRTEAYHIVYQLTIDYLGELGMRKTRTRRGRGDWGRSHSLSEPAGA